MVWVNSAILAYHQRANSAVLSCGEILMTSGAVLACLSDCWDLGRKGCVVYVGDLSVGWGRDVPFPVQDALSTLAFI